MAVVGVVAVHIGEGSGVHEARQGVHMGVGVVAFQVAVVEPPDGVHAQGFPQPSFQRRLVQCRVAVGVAQTGAGGEQMAVAVGIDGAAFQDQVLRMQGHAPGQGAVEPVVEGRFEFAAPAGEAEIQQHRRAVFLHGDGAEIPCPGVVVVGDADAQPAAVGAAVVDQCPGGLRRFTVAAYQQHRFVVEQRLDQGKIGVACRGQPAGPVGVLVGPGQQDAPLGVPLR